jgi:hypothetical protein
MISHHSFASFPTAKKKERRIEKQIMKKQEVVVELTGIHLSSLSCLIAESSWPTSEVTQKHLQNFVSKGYMTTTEFATSLVPADPISPAPARGYIVVCVAFFK